MGNICFCCQDEEVEHLSLQSLFRSALRIVKLLFINLCVCPLTLSHQHADVKERTEVEDSIKFYVDCAKEDGDEYPAVFDGEYEIVYKFNVQSLLEFYRGIFSFSSLETITGINQKQLAHYASGISKPRPKQAQKIAQGLHRLAHEMMVVTV